MSAPSVRLVWLRVALKLMTGFGLLLIIWFVLRYVFNVQQQPRGGVQVIDISALGINQSLVFTRLGREILLVRTAAESVLLVNQRSPEFSCLLEVQAMPEGLFLQDPCTGDLFDPQGKVLAGQRAQRNLQPLEYVLNAEGNVVLND